MFVRTWSNQHFWNLLLHVVSYKSTKIAVNILFPHIWKLYRFIYVMCVSVHRAKRVVVQKCNGVSVTSQPHFVSLHIRSMWETTVMHKQVPGWTVNFGPNFPDQSLLRNTPPHFWKLQIWDDQSLLRNTPSPPKKIVRESRSEIFWIPRFTTCGDFIQPG